MRPARHALPLVTQQLVERRRAAEALIAPAAVDALVVPRARAKLWHGGAAAALRRAVVPCRAVNVATARVAGAVARLARHDGAVRVGSAIAEAERRRHAALPYLVRVFAREQAAQTVSALAVERAEGATRAALAAPRVVVAPQAAKARRRLRQQVRNSVCAIRAAHAQETPILFASALRAIFMLNGKNE